MFRPSWLRLVYFSSNEGRNFLMSVSGLGEVEEGKMAISIELATAVAPIILLDYSKQTVR